MANPDIGIAVTTPSSLFSPHGRVPVYEDWINRLSRVGIEPYAFDLDIFDPDRQEPDRAVIGAVDGLLIAGSGLLSLITVDRIVMTAEADKPIFSEESLLRMFKREQGQYSSPIRAAMARTALELVDNQVIKQDANKIFRKLGGK